MVGLNNAIKSIYVLISFKAVDCKMISKARTTSLLAAKSRKISSNFFKSQIGRDKLNRCSCPSSFLRNFAGIEREGAHRRVEDPRRHAVNAIIGINVSAYLCGKLFEQSYHDGLITLLQTEKDSRKVRDRERLF